VAEQEIGDQVTGQREEDPDAQHAPLSRAHVQVIRDHAQHSHGTNAIEAGYVTPAGLNWPRHG
jgi:hypothetical protein